MRLSTRLILNASTTYVRLGASLVLGVFFTWYVVGKIGMIGLGMIGLVSATFGISGSVELAIRQSLIREMAVAIATGERGRIRKSLMAAAAFCVPAAGLALLITLGLAGLAYIGFFNTEQEVANLPLALTVMLAAEGVHVTVRLILSPFTQSLFAAQRVGLDNLLQFVHRLMNAFSAVIVFGFWLPDAPVATQLMGYAASRASIQMADIFLGTILARSLIPGLQLRWREFDWHEFRTISSTVWHTGQVTLLMNLNVQAVSIIINLFFGLTYNGIWQVVVQLGGGARLLAEGLMRGIEPLATHMKAKGQHVAIADLMVRTIRYQLAVTLPVVVLVIIYVSPLLNLWVAGRMAKDTNLAASGITVPEAIAMIAAMANVYLVAAVLRTSVRGVERTLYGLGHVRSYAWFAKYAFVINVTLAAAIMWLVGSPLGAPASLLITYILYYPGVILRAAKRVVGMRILPALRRSVPRPLIGVLLLSVPLLLIRTRLDSLTLWSLLTLLAATGVIYLPILYVVIAEPDERARIRQLLPTARKHAQG